MNDNMQKLVKLIVRKYTKEFTSEYKDGGLIFDFANGNIHFNSAMNANKAAARRGLESMYFKTAGTGYWHTLRVDMPESRNEKELEVLLLQLYFEPSEEVKQQIEAWLK